MDDSGACPDTAGIVAVLTIGTPAVHLCGDTAQVQIALIAVPTDFNDQSGKCRGYCLVVGAVVCLPVRADKVPDGVQRVVAIGNKPAVAINIHGLICRILRDNRQGRSRCRCWSC